MATLADIMVYLCKHYPYPGELSKARLTKMVYLADWKSALDRRRQISPIAWVFSHYGPYVDDVVRTAASDPRFVVTPTETMYGNRKDLIQVDPMAPEPPLEPEDTAILDAIIEITRDLYWNDFTRLVYSTYPVDERRRYSQLDLVELADEYQAAASASAGA